MAYAQRPVLASAASVTKVDDVKSNASAEGQEPFKWFEPLTNTAKYNEMERYSLFAVLGVAVAGLIYAGMLVGQVIKADKGTQHMQEIAGAVAKGPMPTFPHSSARSGR